MDSSEALVTWSSGVRRECLRNMVVFFFFGESISATGDGVAEDDSRCNTCNSFLESPASPRELVVRVVLSSTKSGTT
jgi:hypothetical protein